MPLIAQDQEIAHQEEVVAKERLSYGDIGRKHTAKKENRSKGISMCLAVCKEGHQGGQ